MSDATGLSSEGDERSLAVGLIFSGQHAHAAGHVGTLDAIDEVESIHLCGIEGGELDEKAALSSKVKSTTRSVEELLAGPKLDAVLVCVQSDLSAGVMQECVDASLPVVFEKPGALTAAELRSVADSARERGLTMGTMFHNRWTPVSQEVRRAVRDGALGRVMTAEARMVTSQVRNRMARWPWMFERATAGSGILGWLGCHLIDLMCYLLDDRVIEVTAMVGTQNPEDIDVEDTALLVMKFGSGALGTLHAGYLLPGGGPGLGYDNFLAMRGVDGYVRVDSTQGEQYSLYSVAPGWAAGGLRERKFVYPEVSAYRDITRDSLRASRTGAPAPAPIEAMVHVLEVIEAALESSETGRAVRIDG